MALRLAPLLAALALAALASAQTQPAPPERPSGRDLQEHEEALARLRDEATSVLDALSEAEGEAQVLEEAAATAEAEARLTAARVAVAQKEEAAAREGLVAQLDLLGPRLRARYRLGRLQRANLLMSARSLGEIVRRKRALEVLLEGDLRLLGSARAALQELEARSAQLDQSRRELSQRNAAAQERRARALRRRDELASMHQALLREQGLREKTIDELYQMQAQLTALVNGLPADDGAKAVRFARRRGKLPFPAAGTLEVGFGKVLNPKFNTVTFQKGIDVRAASGSEVVAVAPGKVVHAGAFRGYGNLVVVDHGDGYHSLYAHLGSMLRAVGDSVEEGRALGTVGDTGSLKGAYLYFELRERGKPVDPKGWLRAPP
jgi:septal ring factor EnvC (AmiA/AmiB activator)